MNKVGVTTAAGQPAVTGDDIHLNAKDFFADIVGVLSGLLEDVVGLSETEGFISAVGARLGATISEDYAHRQGKTDMDARPIGDILVDIKHRIGGTFAVESVADDEIVLVNGRCPFGERVIGKQSLCMMTTTVFGRVTADRNGYAHVSIPESIAAGHNGCRVIVRLGLDDQPPDAGHEYFSE